MQSDLGLSDCSPDWEGWVLLQALLLSCVGEEVKTWTTGPSGTAARKLQEWQAKITHISESATTDDAEEAWAAHSQLS
jgi:hypothetical protein